MDLIPEERPSDSPFVERVWHGQSGSGGPFISMADIHCSIVITRLRGQTFVTVRGPETSATPAYAPPDAEFLGIVFKPGAFMPDLPATRVMDRRDVNLPEATSQSFWLKGSAWQVPDFDNADTFVNRLARAGVLVHEPAVGTALRGHPARLSLRTVQRRFLQATGITQNTLFQIKRARYALTLLKQGVSILDTVELAGYFDQPHLTRSLKRLIGQTPAQIINASRQESLSFSYKTDAHLFAYDKDVLATTKG
ncbi:MAG: helix-turn-helix domain-containing protein [Anaerolineae bacterium]|nr:helix-turn-helix domain-containing protein [Anaerolineae bacterium]